MAESTTTSALILVVTLAALASGARKPLDFSEPIGGQP